MGRHVASSLKEYGRGVAGGLLFSLPLLYTMEVWWSGFVAGPQRLLIYLLVTFALLIGYNRFSGIRRDVSYREVLIDSTEEMGLGLLLSALVLWLLGRITPEMGLNEVTGKIVVESMIVAIGVSVGTEQLGGSGPQSGKQDEGGKKSSTVAVEDSAPNGEQPNAIPVMHHVVMSLCGAILIAANVAPTQEIVVIAAEVHAEKLLGIVGISMALGVIILYFSEFTGSQRMQQPEGVVAILDGILITYGVALVASAFMLWFFDRFDGFDVYTILAEVVVLAFPASLGASAGRLLLGA